ncbi:exodeoxyribonuclease VII large subunit [Candidatus Magnetominusculus xianensis]|uniref:Exodeoxyribonuclease 7 large subunit n=1 Tax=Candidatus Magnetominusculus xianensis TaxID=1748249 RepID=A0ABR5SJG3_9BACT|nr:exodeoxyribonuclease VII large subunit [Candidatus Magnetominusculus xianensis]KWT86077.1 exodeoxyribonuclease VII large subunit [Candidatus Magnetominusculus xianensis]MBF0404406.1 exodeoxyribonuclease VII large subunit [Nitrospirota bacterium]
MPKTSDLLSLYEFNLIVKEALAITFPARYLIKAETASLNIDAKGHCYLELIEKDDTGIKAQMGARVWASTWKTVSKEFKSATGQSLTKGMKILVEATLNFHERFGLSLIVQNIDPSYTLGEMALAKRQIIERLTKEGLIDKNKAVPFPIVPLRIAVLSSKTAAGYEDFVKHLRGNPYGYAFSVTLFETAVQGDAVEATMLRALSLCRARVEAFDCVVITRGGGGASDLDCFNNYAVAREIALFPIPVISGIGHERDKTVIDETAHVTIKTPTAAAAFIIERVGQFEGMIDAQGQRLLKSVETLCLDASGRLFLLSKAVGTAVAAVVMRHRFMLEQYAKGICRDAPRQLEKHGERLNRALSAAGHLNPENILKRGFSITSVNGKALRSAAGISAGERLTTLLYDGSIESEAVEITHGVKDETGI